MIMENNVMNVMIMEKYVMKHVEEIIWESLSSKPPNHDQGGFGPITRMPEQQQVLQVISSPSKLQTYL